MMKLKIYNIIVETITGLESRDNGALLGSNLLQFDAGFFKEI